MRIQNYALAAALLGAAMVLGLAGAARADLTLTNTSAADEFTITDTGGCAGSPGGCIPVGQTGYIVNDTAPNIVAGAHDYLFTYLGAGDSQDHNMFQVIVGGVPVGTFCSQADASCTPSGRSAGQASQVGDSFDVDLAADDIPFEYTNITTGCTLGNSSTTNAGPGGCADYFVSLDDSTATPGLTGPSQPFGYIGLTDLQYPGDHDFQDLGVLVTEVPEPASMALFGSALLGMGFRHRRNKKQA